MRPFHRILPLLMVATLFFYACQTDDSIPEDAPGAVRFSLSEIDAPVGGSANGVEDFENVRSLIVTIEDDLGNVIYDQEQIDVFDFNGVKVGEPLSINPGNYRLTEFLVLDDQGAVVYATPIEGSEYDHLVADPLPINFAIVTDETTEVVPEVIDTSEFIPEDFGYATFRFTLAEHFNFLISAFIYDNAQENFALTTANLTVYEQGTQNVLHAVTLGDTTNIIAIRDGYDYRLLIEKQGYTSQDLNFTNAELKAFETDPLEVIFTSLENLPSETFAASAQNFSSLDASSVTAADVDNDGDLDLFITRANGNPTEILLNDGAGNYTTNSVLGNMNNTNAALGDLDNDGDLDAFLVQWSEQPNTVWLNDGSGNFTDTGQQFGASATWNVVLGDLDNDGDLDAVINDYYNLPVLLNDGTGTFTQVAQISGSLEATDIALADLNGDGHLDIYAANSGPTFGLPNRVFFNDGLGNFTDSGQTIGNGRSVEVVLADVDGDSDLDAFVGSQQEPSKVWINNGSGVFSDSGQSLGTNYVRDIILVDFDLDGDLDAFTVYDSNQSYILWQNDGSGNFSDSGLNFGNYNGRGVTSGDFDLDGDIDVFVVNAGGQDVLLLGEQN